MRTVLCGSAVALCVLGFEHAALAAGPLGPNGSTIATSAYGVDLSHGLVLDGSRPTGLGGAYVAIGDGTDGMHQNPAAPALRTPYSFDDFDYDLGVGVTLPTTVASADYFNTGARTTNVGVSSQRLDFLFWSVAGLLQWGPWGVGAALDVQNYGLQAAADATTVGHRDELRASFLTGHVQLARAVGDVVVGGGFRLTGLSIVRTQGRNGVQSDLFDSSGSAVEAGAVWRPAELPFRIGASVHSSVNTDAVVVTDAVVFDATDRIIPGDPNQPGDFSVPGTLYLPDQVTLPWDVDVGVALQLGPRPMNPRWVNPRRVLLRLTRYLEWRRRERRRRAEAEIRRVERGGGDVAAARAALDAEEATASALDEARLARERDRVDRELRHRYADLARFYVLISASLVVVGPVSRGVGVESFLQRRVNRSGEHGSLSPRLGMESEIVPHYLEVRAGTYLEPTRFSTPNAAARLHATFGFDARLVPWSVFGLLPKDTCWRAGAVIDAAPRYLGWGASLGVWH
jgi:hypothetical protein